MNVGPARALQAAKANGTNGTNSSDAQAPCESLLNCTTCSDRWPTCAWCGSTGSCRTAPADLRNLVGTRASSYHVVYGSEEYKLSYGSNYGLPNSGCGTWLFNRASCGHVEDFCTDFGTSCTSCTRIGGCGYCHSSAGPQCLAGTLSGEIIMSADGRQCKNSSQASSSNSSAMLDPARWMFGNWTLYYANGTWDSGCQMSCSSSSGQVLTAWSGELKQGIPEELISYAPDQRCFWDIRPANWPDGYVLQVRIQFYGNASIGDVVTLQRPRTATSQADLLSVGDVGCTWSTGQDCEVTREASTNSPAWVRVKFSSGSRMPGQPSKAAWRLVWQLGPVSTTLVGQAGQTTSAASSSVLGGSSFGTPSPGAVGVDTTTGLWLQSTSSTPTPVTTSPTTSTTRLWLLSTSNPIMTTTTSTSLTIAVKPWGTPYGGGEFIIWIGVITMALPLLGIFLILLWRWYRRPAIDRAAQDGQSSANQQANQRAVDMAKLEQEIPSCKPKAIGPPVSQDGEGDPTNGLTCSVCLAEFEEGQQVRELPCNHNFHVECIDIWFATHAACPLCRRELPSSLVSPPPAGPSRPGPAPQAVPPSTQPPRRELHDIVPTPHVDDSGLQGTPFGRQVMIEAVV